MIHLLIVELLQGFIQVQFLVSQIFVQLLSSFDELTNFLDDLVKLAYQSILINELLSTVLNDWQATFRNLALRSCIRSLWFLAATLLD